jgi:hypothetical protein
MAFLELLTLGLPVDFLRLRQITPASVEAISAR